jgi:predicted transcriptional regulator
VKEHNYIENLLTKGEQFVYLFIKEQSVETGSVKISMDRMAELISEKYKDLIPLRKKKAANGSQVEERSFSEATVHRAVQKLKKEGIIVVRPSENKDEPNEILFYGLPNEEQQVDDLLTMASQLNASLQRFHEILSKKDNEIETLKRERKTMFQDLDGMRERIQQLTELNQNLQKQIGGSNPFGEGELIHVEDLGDGTTAYIVKK